MNSLCVTKGAGTFGGKNLKNAHVIDRNPVLVLRINVRVMILNLVVQEAGSTELKIAPLLETRTGSCLNLLSLQFRSNCFREGQNEPYGTGSAQGWARLVLPGNTAPHSRHVRGGHPAWG